LDLVLQFVCISGELRELSVLGVMNIIIMGVRPLCSKIGKAIPLQAWTGPEGSRRLRLPDFQTIGT
jgi:hypothetical protein